MSTTDLFIIIGFKMFPAFVDGSASTRDKKRISGWKGKFYFGIKTLKGANDSKQTTRFDGNRLSRQHWHRHLIIHGDSTKKVEGCSESHEQNEKKRELTGISISG